MQKITQPYLDNIASFIDIEDGPVFEIDIDLIDTFLQKLFLELSASKISFFIDRSRDYEIKIAIFLATTKYIYLKTDTKVHSFVHKLKVKCAKFTNIIPIIGPDGVGKTTILESLIKHSSVDSGLFRFKKSYRVSPLFYILYPLFWLILKLKRRGEVDKLEVDERFAPIIFFIALFMYPFRALKYKLKNKTMFSDRYFYDFMFDNILFNQENPKLRDIYKLYLHFTPLAYFIIHLDAPNETILSRKKEMRSIGMDIYREGMFKLCTTHNVPFYIYINTTNTIQNCTDNILNAFKMSNINF